MGGGTYANNLIPVQEHEGQRGMGAYFMENNNGTLYSPEISLQWLTTAI